MFIWRRYQEQLQSQALLSEGERQVMTQTQTQTHAALTNAAQQKLAQAASQLMARMTERLKKKRAALRDQHEREVQQVRNVVQY